MLPNLDVLVKKCEKLGLTVVPKGKRPAKDDYVQVLRSHFLAIDFPQGLPYNEVEPMLCYPEWELKESEQKNIWTSPSWVVQKKLNGCRMIMHFVKGVGVFAHGRNESNVNFRYEEYSDRFVFKGSYVPDFDAIIDCEAIIDKPITTQGYTTGKKKSEATKSSLHSTSAVMALEADAARRLQIDQDAPLTFQIFDILSLYGVNLTSSRLQERLASLKMFEIRLHGPVNDAINKYCFFPEVVYENRREYHLKTIKEGGEGTIAKNLNASYQGGKRGREIWVKVKKRIEFDAYVIGFEPGEVGAGFENYVGNLKFGVMTEVGEHWIGSPSNMTLEMRKEMTETVDGKPQLKKEWYGKVAEISGQDISSRSLRLSHCTIDRWRTDGIDGKTKDQCVVKMEELRTAAEWVS